MRPVAATLAVLAVGGVIIWWVFAKDAADQDLATQVASANAAIEVDVADVTRLVIGDELDLSGQVSDSSSFVIYKVNVGSGSVVTVDDAERPNLVGTVDYFRGVADTRSFENLAEGGTRAILISEILLQSPPGAPARTFQTIVLGADGRPIDSDWHGTPLEPQFTRLAAAVDAAGLRWTDAMALLITAARAEELGVASPSDAGASLLAAMRAEG
jgi:hypothetical protein